MLHGMKVLFICDGNVARSQEAELFFNSMAGTHHHASSAGTNPVIGKPIDPAVVEVMSEQGYDMQHCYRKAIGKHVTDEADVVVSFKPLEELPVSIAHHNKLRYWNVPDPKGQSLDVHRRTRDDIRARVAALVAELGRV